MKLEMENRAPFLGTGKYRFTGAADIRLRVRAASGGPGQVHWRLADEAEFTPEHIAKFDFLTGDEWHDVTVAVPAQGHVAQLRLYLPAGKGALELAALDVRAKSATPSTKPPRK